MKHARRRSWVMVLSLIAVLTLGIVISLLVLGGPERDFTATAYSDVIRFQAEGVATLQVRLFDLSGKEVWDSGVVSGNTVDWDRRNDTGERLAYGAYIYSAQGWNAQGDLIFQKNGKLALMPGGTVQLQAAPAVLHPREVATPESNDAQARPMAGGTACGCNEFSGANSDVYVAGKLGIGTTNPSTPLDARRTTYGSSFHVENTAGSATFAFTNWLGKSWNIGALGGVVGTNGIGFTEVGVATHMVVLPGGTVGIGTTNPTAKLTVEDSGGQDLIAAYNSSNRVFAVKSTGEVRADGAYYSGAGDCNTGGFNAGGADVAERINVSEWVEAGYVVEIDPEHPGFFRKSSSPYSRKVAGIISTSPGVILGNNFDEATDDWEDNRPVLAIAGRVPLQVTTENGPIQIGDFLVSSSTPGLAMKGNSEKAMGAVVGKAMEPLEEGEGVIVVQVMLR